jgi:hypothetical protein
LVSEVSPSPGVVKPAAPGPVSPGVVSPGVVKPGEVSPGEANPGAVRPGEVSPGAVKPGEVRTGEEAGADPVRRLVGIGGRFTPNWERPCVKAPISSFGRSVTIAA